MSRAFVKEDTDIPERSHRRRGASGLPPGAVNYMTERGARQLREQAVALLRAGKTEAAADVERLVASAEIVRPPEQAPGSVTFGATVTVQTANGAVRKLRIVGVDEVGLEPDTVSWISPEGRALLGAERGQRCTWEPNGEQVTILNIEQN